MGFFGVFILRERERESTCTWAGEGQRKKERESQAGSSLIAWSLKWGSISQTVRSWLELKSRVGRLTDWPTHVSLNVFLTKWIKEWGHRKVHKVWVTIFCSASIKTSINSNNVMNFQNIMTIKDRKQTIIKTHTYKPQSERLQITSGLITFFFALGKSKGFSSSTTIIIKDSKY